LPDKPSIAILPFQNMSGDPEQEYFADGMVEDITAGLSRIKWLFVIAHNSSFVYGPMNGGKPEKAVFGRMGKFRQERRTVIRFGFENGARFDLAMFGLRKHAACALTSGNHVDRPAGWEVPRSRGTLFTSGKKCVILPKIRLLRDFGGRS
jgi:hypothetical protein